MANKLQQIASGKTTGSDEVKSTPASKGGNLTTAVRNRIMAIVQSLEIMEGEREAQKAILKQLKDENDIEPKVARKVANILHKDTSTEEMQSELDAVSSLLLSFQKDDE